MRLTDLPASKHKIRALDPACALQAHCLEVLEDRLLIDIGGVRLVLRVEAVR